MTAGDNITIIWLKKAGKCCRFELWGRNNWGCIKGWVSWKNSHLSFTSSHEDVCSVADCILLSFSFKLLWRMLMLMWPSVVRSFLPCLLPRLSSRSREVTRPPPPLPLPLQKARTSSCTPLPLLLYNMQQ